MFNLNQPLVSLPHRLVWRLTRVLGPPRTQGFSLIVHMVTIGFYPINSPLSIFS